MVLVKILEKGRHQWVLSDHLPPPPSGVVARGAVRLSALAQHPATFAAVHSPVSLRAERSVRAGLMVFP